MEVTTADSDEPYETEETGKSLEVVETPLSTTTTVADVDGELTSTKIQTAIKTEYTVDDGTNSTSVKTEADKHTIDTGGTLESAVLGETLKGLIEDLIDAIDGIATTVPALGLISGAVGTPVTGVASGSLDSPSKAALVSVKSGLSAMLLTNLKIG